ncbi:hypothetical protein [Fodinibius sp. Rm-B-1B1-1]|uniref:hypothetical protein n=1 Tax=Fodinibius alkaliphilus TaxID=3140241 RepID=UPI003159DEC7
MNFSAIDRDQLKGQFISFLKRWWASLIMLPFMFYSIHQVYWALNYNIFFAVNYSYPFPLDIIYLFVDTFILIVHEAGHTFFGLLGWRFLTILGGSLFQVLLPLAIVLFFWINRKSIGLQFSFLLLGFSWLDVATYAADGSARQLPLIGGLGKESHDWYNLLVRMDALEYDMTYGLTFIAIGIACYLAAILIPFFYRNYKSVDLDLQLD